MDRRDFLKLASVTGVGLVAVSLPFRGKAEKLPQFFMITKNPEHDVRNLLRAAGLSETIKINSMPVQPAGQDLSVMWNGKFRDPLKDPEVPASIRDFAGRLRKRETNGHSLVTIEKYSSGAGNIVTFEYNGKIVEQVSLDTDYDSIEIPGEFGATIFEIRNGKVEVTRSSCGNHLCENQGAVRSGRIVCAPNKLVANVRYGINQLDCITG